MTQIKIIVITIIVLSCFLESTAQNKTELSFHMGIEIKADKVRSSQIEGQTLYWNYGLKNQLEINNKWIIELGFHHSIRDYELKQPGLIFESDIINGTSSYYSSIVEEKFVEVENQFKYQFLNKKLQPFVGLGYSIQLPYSISGERKIVHSDGMIENLSNPDELSTKLTYGVYSSTGINLELIDRLNLILEFGHRWYYNSNLNIYGFPTIDEHPNRHKSFIFGVSTLYQLK